MKKRSEKGTSGLSSLLVYYRNEARRKGFEFALTREQFREVVSGECHFCGAKPEKIIKGPKSRQSRYGEDHSEFLANDLERANLSLGYIPGNCVTCCPTCRKIKKDMDAEEFYSWLEKTHRFSKKQQANIPTSAKPIFAH